VFKKTYFTNPITKDENSNILGGIEQGLANARKSLKSSMRKSYPMQCLPLLSIILAATKSE
jgi:hypothetical protein